MTRAPRPSSLAIDAYHLTTLCAHADAGRLDHRVDMAFFFRKLPAHRNFVLFCGLRQVIEHARAMALDADEIRTIETDPVIGPAVAARPAVLERLRGLDGFEGDIDGMAEGEVAFAGPAYRTGGEPLEILGRHVVLYEPLLQVHTDMTRSKLVETPWLSRINHLSMVASKAARVVLAAKGRPVIEFGQRRTHPEAAADASYAAWIAGCHATSNMLAAERYGIPATGTMDHFFVQSEERDGVPPAESERLAFRRFYEAFPEHAILLVDTYDTERGIRNAVEATGGRLAGIRLDSNVSPETVRRARKLLDDLGASRARIVVSDRLDEYRVGPLADAGADAFGVGERIVCSPDAAAGIGAVAKIVRNGYGRDTMKLSPGKISIPGRIQVVRYDDHDLLATQDETTPPGGTPLYHPLWRGRSPVGPATEDPATARRRAQERLAALPAHLRGPATDHGRPFPLVVSDALVDRIHAEVQAILGRDA
ncbi:MAG: hypothetical protein D6705_04960 [Deltaproteobacteria bacterium]|nr:MAG: hypothetical protein D6705_04960 [Deltaproteobacteria bacterium]